MGDCDTSDVANYYLLAMNNNNSSESDLAMNNNSSESDLAMNNNNSSSDSESVTTGGNTDTSIDHHFRGGHRNMGKILKWLRTCEDGYPKPSVMEIDQTVNSQRGIVEAEARVRWTSWLRLDVSNGENISLNPHYNYRPLTSGSDTGSSENGLLSESDARIESKLDCLHKQRDIRHFSTRIKIGQNCYNCGFLAPQSVCLNCKGLFHESCLLRPAHNPFGSLNTTGLGSNNVLSTNESSDTTDNNQAHYTRSEILGQLEKNRAWGENYKESLEEMSDKNYRTRHAEKHFKLVKAISDITKTLENNDNNR